MTSLYPGGQRPSAPLTAMGAPAPQPTAGAVAVPAPKQPAPTSAPSPADRQDPQPAAGTGRSTPRTLSSLRVASLASAILVGLLCVVATLVPYDSVAGARVDIEQGLRLRSVQADLAEAQAIAARTAAAGTTDTTEFDAQMATVSDQLLSAVAAYPADQPGLTKVNDAVNGYRSAIDRALISSGDRQAAAVEVARVNTAVNTSAMEPLDELLHQADGRIASRFQTFMAPVVVLAGIVAIVVALAASVQVALRTRRVLNSGLVLAVVLLGVSLALTWAQSSSLAQGAAAASGNDLAVARAAYDTKTIMYRAVADELGTRPAWATYSAQVTARLAAAGNPAEAVTAWEEASTLRASGDVSGAQQKVDAAADALDQLAGSHRSTVLEAVSFTLFGAYGVTAALLALGAAALGAWGISTRLDEYR